MRGTYLRRPILFVAGILLIAACCSNTGREKTAIAAGTFPKLDDLISLQRACTIIATNLAAAIPGNDTTGNGLFNSVIDSAADSLRTAAIVSSNPAVCRDAILDLVYRTWHIGFDSCDIAVGTLLPHLVYRNRKGACLGASLVILMLAEKLGCPIYGVVVPEHFYCRYDDGIRRVNIEPNRQGCDHPDDYYRKRYPVDHRPWYDFENLSKMEVIGVLCYDAGSICLRHRQLSAAIDYFRECLRRLPSFAEAKGNLAVAFAQAGKKDSALTVFEALMAAHPDMINLAANYGTVAAAAGHYNKAIEIYRTGLAYYPSDPVLLWRMADAWARLGKNDSAAATRRMIR